MDEPDRFLPEEAESRGIGGMGICPIALVRQC
jgi:hypothetical protein